MREEKFYVNMYSCGRAYGGPEEGGWYYDYGEFKHHIITVDSLLKARAIAERIREAIKNGDAWQEEVANLRKNQMGFGPSDGAGPDGEGDDRYLMPGGAWGDESLHCCVEPHPGKDYPEERPYYE